MLVGTGFGALGWEPVALRDVPSTHNSPKHHFGLFHATVCGRTS